MTYSEAEAAGSTFGRGLGDTQEIRTQPANCLPLCLFHASSTKSTKIIEIKHHDLA